MIFNALFEKGHFRLYVKFHAFLSSLELLSRRGHRSEVCRPFPAADHVYCSGRGVLEDEERMPCKGQPQPAGRHSGAHIPAGDAEAALIIQAGSAIYKRLHEMGDTLSGEHGIGFKRKGYIKYFLEEEQIELIKRVKLAFDPRNILNPGKLVEWQ